MAAAMFSAIIPAHNAASTLGAAMQSVLAQTHNELELIVVDDGSTDDTREVAEAFAVDPRVSIVSQEQRGLAAARNAGVGHARTPLLGFLEADDLWMPDYVASVIRTLDSDRRAGIAYSDAWILDDETRSVHRRLASDFVPELPAGISPDDLALRLVARNLLPYCSTVRREAIEAAGGYDASLTAVEDWDLWIRIAACGYGAVRVPRPLVIWRDRPGSMSKDRLLMLTNVRQVLVNVVTRYDVPELARVAARRRLREVELTRRALRGERSPRAAVRRTRLRLARLRRRIARRLDLLPEPPPDIAAAFPDLVGPPTANSSSAQPAGERS